MTSCSVRRFTRNHRVAFPTSVIAEAELASEAARPKPRRNRTSGLMFVLKTSPWRPGDLSLAKMRNGLQKYQCQEPHTQNKMANHQPFCRKATQTIDRFGENAPGRGWRDTKREPFVRNATQNVYRRAEKGAVARADPRFLRCYTQETAKSRLNKGPSFSYPARRQPSPVPRTP